MPKKFKGENSKAVVAKERKAAVEREKIEKLNKEKEDALWADDDKTNAKKQQRKVFCILFTCICIVKIYRGFNS